MVASISTFEGVEFPFGISSIYLLEAIDKNIKEARKDPADGGAGGERGRKRS